MLHFPTPDAETYHAKVRAFAEQVGALDAFTQTLTYLDQYGGADSTRCLLFPMLLTPLSFDFLMEQRAADGTWRPWFNGGVLYSGPGQPLDGSAPAFCVDLGAAWRPLHSWSVHT